MHYLHWSFLRCIIHDLEGDFFQQKQGVLPTQFPPQPLPFFCISKWSLSVSLSLSLKAQVFPPNFVPNLSPTKFPTISPLAVDFLRWSFPQVPFPIRNSLLTPRWKPPKILPCCSNDALPVLRLWRRCKKPRGFVPCFYLARWESWSWCCFSRWWFQIDLFFIPKIGEMTQFD